MDEDKINGFGRRLNDTEKEVVEIKTLAKRNTTDIEKIFKSMATLPWKVLGIVSIPSAIMVYRIIVEK